MRNRRHLSRHICIALTALWGIAGSAQATIIFDTGNQQFDHQVNFPAEDRASEIQGDLVGSSPLRHLHFMDAYNPEGNHVELHAQHGVAFVEGCNFENTNDCIAPHSFRTLTLEPDSQWGWSGMDWKLDVLNGADKGFVYFTAYDQLGDTFTKSFAIDDTGQQPFHLHTEGGELVTKLVISAFVEDDPASAPLALVDIKQVSVNDAEIQVAPEPATLTLLGLGLAGLGFSRRKR